MAEITEREQRQIDQANSSGKTPVVFIHGSGCCQQLGQPGRSVRGERYAGVTPPGRTIQKRSRKPRQPFEGSPGAWFCPAAEAGCAV
jgi:hypothetical protein